MGTEQAITVGRGVYDARRAAALAGVPLSTLNYWAREGIYAPSISPGPRDRLWSWADLLALRAIHWFRKQKEEGPPSVTMRRIRTAIGEMEANGLSRAQLHTLGTSAGRLFVSFSESNGWVRADGSRQGVLEGLIQFARPYDGAPSLTEPRPHLRIIPGKLHGEPHVVGTRIPSAALFALAAVGYDVAGVANLYPMLDHLSIEEAIDLERSLNPLAVA